MGLQGGILTLSSTLLSPPLHGLTVWPSHSLLNSTLPSASCAYSLTFSLSPSLHSPFYLNGLYSGLLTLSLTSLYLLPHGLTVWPVNSLLHSTIHFPSLDYSLALSLSPPTHSPLCLMAYSLAFLLSPSHHSPLYLMGLQSGLCTLSSTPYTNLPNG